MSGADFYAYANNDPLNNTDPSGLVVEAGASAVYGAVRSGVSLAYNNPAQTLGIAVVVGATFLQPENAPALPEEIGAIAETAGATRLASVAAAEGGAGAIRGGEGGWGRFSSYTNGAGGQVYTSEGTINQNMFSNTARYSAEDGPVNILSGVHGAPNGSYESDVGMYEYDVETFKNTPNVTVHNFNELTTDQINSLLNSPGTTIGGFCDSCAVLAPYR